MSKAGHRSLGSFLRNVLDSSQQLTKIRNEVLANEGLDDTVRQHPVNMEYSQPRQKRKAKVIPEAKVSDKAVKDPNMLRRVLNLYMKRAQMFRHGKGQNLIEDAQQKFSESDRGKREFHSTYVVIPSGNNLQKSSDKFGQPCRHEQSSCERNKIRRRRWKGKSRNCDKNKAQNDNNEKCTSIVDSKIDIVNREAAATDDIQSKYTLSNMAQKGTSDVQNIASYQENTLPVNSMISKQSGSADSSVNSPSSVVPGSGYDLDCVHEIPSLEGSLLSRNFKGSSSLTDNFSNANDLKPTNDIALNGQEEPIDSKSSKSVLVSQTENLNDQLSLNEMANKQEKLAEAPEQTSFSSDGASSGEALDIVNPIVVEVLEKVSKASNETSDNDGGIEGSKRLATVKNIRLPEAHEEIQAKTSSIDKFSGEKSTFIKSKYESQTKDSAGKNNVATLGNLFQKSHENDLAKKHPLRSKTFQMLRENYLKNGQSIVSKTYQLSHENDLTKSLLNSGHDLSDKSGHKQERVPVSNIKGKANQIQKSKWSESLSMHKTPLSINKPIYKPSAPVSNRAQKGLKHSGQQKLEKVNPLSLYSKNHASLPKSKLDSDIILRTELLHGSKSDQASIIQAKTNNKAKNSEMSLKQKTKNIKQKRNTVEETYRIQKNTEYDELKDDINKRNSREINGNTPKQQNILGFSRTILGENENIKSSNPDGTLLTSESRDQMDAEEAGQGEETENNQQLMNINKRSLKLNDENQHEELVMTGDAQNIDQENDLSVGHQSKVSDPLRRKRHASRFRKHLRKGKRQYQQEGDSKLTSSDKYALKDYNASPFKNVAKHTNSENREDSVHQNMLRQVEDMILALKEENHKTPLKYGSGFSQRIGRRLQSMIDDEARDNSDGSSDNDDYYYYDEADVDKRRPEHSKVSQKLNRKEILDKLDPTSMRKKQMYIQKPFGGTEYLNTENPTNIDYSNNNDPYLNPIQREQVSSDLITSESNKISRFNKEMPEEVLEARYNRSVIQNERGRDYEENIMENNSLQRSSSRRTDETNQNISADKNNPRPSLRKSITANENHQITRLNEGKLEQLNNALNEIVLNQTATSWNDIGHDEIGYNAHMRYKRAGNLHELDSSLKKDGELSVKKEHIAEETTRIKEPVLQKSTNLGESGKENTFLSNANLSQSFNLEKEDKNNKTTVSQIDILSNRNSSSFMENKPSTLNDTVLNYMKDDYKRHSNLNKHRDEVTKFNSNTGENDKGSTTKSAMQIPLSKNKGIADIIINVQNVSEHSNVTSKIGHTQQHLQSVVSSRDNYKEDMLPQDAIRLESKIGQHEGENKKSGDLQEFNLPRYSYDEKIEPIRNKKFGIEENMLNNGIPGNESTKEITEDRENSKQLLEVADAKDNITRYEAVTTEKQHLAEILQDSLLSPKSITKFKEMSLESSKVLQRNKRNDEEYTGQILEELPDYTDYSESEMDGYTHINSTSGDAIILHIVLGTTESTNESLGNTKTSLGATQHNTYNTADNSKYVTSPIITTDATEARESLPTSPTPDLEDSERQNAEKVSLKFQTFNIHKDYNDNSLPTSSKRDQGDSDTRNAEKIPVEYQSFNMPKDYNDNSQLNNTINGALASKMVDLVFEAVNASENLKHHLGGILKKTDYGSQEKQPSYETGISQEMLEKEEEQYHQKTGSLLSKVMELLDVLVEEEVSKRSCISLQPELHEFLLWMLELPEPGNTAPSEFSVPDNFLFMKRNNRPHDKTKENQRVTVSVSNQNMDLKELNQQIELLRELIAEYLQLPDGEKAKVNYVHAFLTEQLQALERIRRSGIVSFRSKVDDEIFDRLSKNRLQGTKGADADLKNAKHIQSKLRYKGKQHDETPFKDSKHISSPNEDSRYSKMMIEHDKSSFRYPSYVSKDNRISNKNSFKTNTDQRSAHKWSKGRQHLMKDVASEPENADTSESHNPVHSGNSIRPHQRKRRYGGHGHGGSKNKHRNITRLHVPTMRYRKLLKRAVEFRERRSDLI